MGRRIAFSVFVFASCVSETVGCEDSAGEFCGFRRGGVGSDLDDRFAQQRIVGAVRNRKKKACRSLLWLSISSRTVVGSDTCSMCLVVVGYEVVVMGCWGSGAW